MKDEIISLIEEGGEFALDSILPDGIVRDLPIIGPAFSLIKIGKDIHDRVFIEKLKSFMQDIDKNQEWKEKFCDADECNKISKQLLYVVDSCDDDDKLRLIGLVFNCFVNGGIDRIQYFYIVNMISKSFYPFLKVLLEIDETDTRFKNDGEKYEYDVIAHLLNIGVLDVAGQTVATFDSKTGKLQSPPSVIVAVNGYGIFIRDILKELN